MSPRRNIEELLSEGVPVGDAAGASDSQLRGYYSDFAEESAYAYANMSESEAASCATKRVREFVDKLKHNPRLMAEWLQAGRRYAELRSEDFVKAVTTRLEESTC